VKGLHEECGSRLTWLIQPYEGGEKSKVVPHGSHSISDVGICGGWHTIAAAFHGHSRAFTGIFLPPSFHLDFNKTTVACSSA
jgi:hypothetical protein